MCPASQLPSTCKLEFQLALDSFQLAEMVLRTSFIAHPGEEAEDLVKHARRLHEQGWSLYLNALTEYAVPPLSPAGTAKNAEKKK